MDEGRIHVAGLKPTDVALLQRVADEAAERAVKKTFLLMGVDPENPMESQADMVFLRATRQRCEGAEGKALITLVGLLVLGVATTFWAGFKGLMHQ